MSRIPIPDGYNSWNEYIEAQADASVDQSRAARMLVKRDIKLGMIAQTERQAAGNPFGGLSVKWDPNHMGPGLYISPGGETALASIDVLENYNIEPFPEPILLTDFAIGSNDKIMISFQIFQISGYFYIYNDEVNFDPTYTAIGLTNRAMNRNLFLGQAGTESIGFSSPGGVWIPPDDPVYNTGMEWSEGCVIDMVVDKPSNLVWFRVNGGIWNGSNTADPATATGGYDISYITGTIYPAGMPWYENRSAEITILNQPVHTVPSGFTFIGGNENNYRNYNVYNTPGTPSPDVAHPWELQADLFLTAESGSQIQSENSDNIIVETN